MLKKYITAILCLFSALPAWAALTELSDGATGVTCQYWDNGAGTAWVNAGGDWVDAVGAAQGTTAFQSANISDTDAVKPVTWDVTTLVRGWASSGTYRGILLRNMAGTNATAFSSREGTAPPTLTIRFGDGTSTTLNPKADSELQCPWVSSIGTRATMTSQKNSNIVLAFDAPRRTDVTSATLTLTTTGQYGATTVGAFQLLQPGAGTTTGSPPPPPTSPPPATEPPTAFNLYDGDSGVTCDYWNTGAQIPWRKRGGDWLDAGGTSQGSVPFAKTVVNDVDKVFPVDLDVTKLVQGWSSAATYRGMMLRVVPGEASGTINISSREGSQAPVLNLQYNDGTTASAVAQADSNIDCSTVYGIGKRTSMSVAPSQSIVLSFNVPRRTDVKYASLRVTTTAQYGNTSVGVYQLRGPDTGQAIPVQQGIAAGYPSDRGIETNPDVVWVERFEQSNFLQRWGYSSVPSDWTAEVISSDTANGFQPLDNSAYRVRINSGTNWGASPVLKTQLAMGQQPDQLYFRYYLRLGSNYMNTPDGGKLPGLSGDTSLAGNGGRPVNGTNGWSLRGSFLPTTDAANPAYPRVVLGTYAYHADMKTNYGDHWRWMAHGLGLIEQNRWYAVEQYVKVNTPGLKDGILKVWIDGKLAYEKYDVNLRTVSGWPIYKVWMDFYYGGLIATPHNIGLYIDNLVVAKRYIGPMAK